MIIKGDVNGDGRIMRDDLVLIQLHLLGCKQLSGEPILDENAFLAADVNSNGEITISDVGIIKMHLLGIKIINEVIY